MRVYRSDVFLGGAQKRSRRAPVHRLDEPAGLSLSMVASPQCRFRFVRQNHSSAAATGATNFRVARDALRTAATPSCQMYDTMTTRQAGCVSNFSREILVAQLLI